MEQQINEKKILNVKFYLIIKFLFIFKIILVLCLRSLGQTSSVNANPPINSITTNSGSISLPQLSKENTNTLNNAANLPSTNSPATSTPSTQPNTASGTAQLYNSMLSSMNGVSQTPKTNPNLLIKYSEYQSYCRDEFSNSLNNKNNFEMIKLDSDSNLNPDDFEKLKSDFERMKKDTFEKFSLHFKILQIAKLLNKIQSYKDWISSINFQNKKKYELFIDAFKLFIEQKYTSASQIFEKNLSEFNEEPEYYLLQAEIYFKLETLFDAKIFLQKAQKNASKDLLVKILNFICKIDALDSNHYEAISSCNAAIEKTPDNTINYVYLGISYREKQNFNEAYKLFKKSNEIKKNEFALICLGEIFQIKKAYQKSIQFFDEATLLDNKSSRGYFAKAQSNFEMANYEKALIEFLNSCKIEKKYLSQFKEAHQKLTAQKNKMAQEYFAKMQSCAN